MKKKILFVISNFNIGGPQKSLLSLLYEIDNERYDCYFISLSGNGTLTKYLPEHVKPLQIPIEVKSFTLPKKETLPIAIRLMKEHNYNYLFDITKTIIYGMKKKNMNVARQILWMKNNQRLPRLNEKFDTAIAVTGGLAMMYITDCVNASNKLSWIRSDYRVLKRDLEIDNIYFSKMDTILSVSNECKLIFDKLFPDQSNKTRVMYNIPPFTMYKNMYEEKQVILDKGVPSILTICRLDPNKGLDLAIKTMKILKENNVKVRWYVLGEGPYRKALEAEIDKNELSEDFILLGAKINTMEVIEQCTLLVHPSRFEGKSNVIDEAKYLRKPIVTTNFETVNEQIIHGSTGMISDMNPQSIYENIKLVLSSKALRERLSGNLDKEKNTEKNSWDVFYRSI